MKREFTFKPPIEMQRYLRSINAKLIRAIPKIVHDDNGKVREGFVLLYILD